MSDFLQIALGVVEHEGKYLVAQRKKHQHQGGKWEFPGGKVEQGETLEQALVRELQEEVGITPTQFQHLITVEHTYPDLSVQLNTWYVTEFQGVAKSGESQTINWVSVEELSQLTFPDANKAIIQAVFEKLNPQK